MSVQIFDNFLSNGEFDMLRSEIGQPKYEWGHVSKVGSVIEYPWLLMNLTDNQFLNTAIKSKIEKTVNMTFNTERIYMNGQMYGSESGFHVDTTDTNGFTFLLFVHDCNEATADSMGGYFYYKLNGEIQCIEPIKNRAVFFNSNIRHKGSAFNRHVRTLRQSIAWKLYHTDSNRKDGNLICPIASYDNDDIIKPTASCDNDFIKPVASYDNNDDLIKQTASYDNDLIRKEVSTVFDSCKNLNGIEQFKPLLSLLTKPYILNCDKSVAICFNDSAVNNTISQLLSSLNT